MKKGWRVILIIVLAALLLGAVAMAVGMMTGADFQRIYSVMDNRYHFDTYIDYFKQVVQIVTETFAA